MQAKFPDSWITFLNISKYTDKFLQLYKLIERFIVNIQDTFWGLQKLAWNWIRVFAENLLESLTCLQKLAVLGEKNENNDTKKR